MYAAFFPTYRINEPIEIGSGNTRLKETIRYQKVINGGSNELSAGAGVKSRVPNYHLRTHAEKGSWKGPISGPIPICSSNNAQAKEKH